MADGWLYDRDGYATLRVPFVFIPEGAAQPADWLVEHPNHIRVPAMFRAARQPSPARAPEEGRSGRGRSSSVADAATAAEPVPGYAPIGPHQGRRYPPPPQIDRSGYFQENPVATYLRINQTLDAMALGATSPLTSKGSQRTNGKYLSTVPQALPGVLSESDTAAVGTAESGSAVDPTAPVELLDGKGKPVKGEPVSSDRAGETILWPAGLSPEFFIRKGLEDRQVMEQLMQTSKDGSQGAIAALMYELNVLSKFRQGGAWDAQRIGAYIIANIATMRPWRLDSTAPQQVSANQRA